MSNSFQQDMEMEGMEEDREVGSCAKDCEGNRGRLTGRKRFRAEPGDCAQ